MRSDAPPTARQIFALATLLCEDVGETCPATRGQASSLIERLRLEQGYPKPRLEDCELRPRMARGRGTERLARAIAAELVREMR
jgi:hypothetical protein